MTSPSLTPDPGSHGAPKRVQRKRTKGWRMPEGAVYVGRPTRWGNPYRLDGYREDWPVADDRELRRMATSDFRDMLEGRWDGPEDEPTYPTVAVVRDQLAGRDLACWCPLDQRCHADVLLALANPIPSPVSSGSTPNPAPTKE